ncbi:hypothetical protein K6119_05385 [Paracrocinitomix mangrovi]|uniref:hypothetical protein n=1 Tax=Paracrocinitomix mangrovi TaxID=2862509 RepID=UPI001C8E3967|nr:hypothetical protein [Paracrocinitomix mangrovi]UKN02946.1 hypothetical protein K6119_05385 [Paracrocinitomix mangrovi]
MKKLLLGLISLSVVSGVWSQTHTNFTTSDYWKGQRKELLFGIGATNFLGDLGGLNKIGTDYSFMDLEWVTTRPSGHLGYRYRLRPWVATKSLLQYGVLRGSDQLTTEPFRHNRNLSFKTHLIEFSQHLELVIYNNEHYGRRNKIYGLKGHRNKNDLLYLFSGISVFAYIPQAEDGTNLRPLNTEGQGLPGGPKKYGLVNIGIPFGMGFKLGLDRVWRMSFELSYTKTFTDYLDDVSGVYYDWAGNGYTEPDYADPSLGAFPNWTNPGEQRGDSKQKDAYFFFNVSIIRNLTQGKGGKVKWRYRARY